MEQISLDIARRYILGRQGLWPGRRWRGPRGTEAAMRALEHLQLDPLVVVARSQDLALHSRVLGYRPDGWEVPTYRHRRFFDWGGWLAVRPMEELPHWRVLMRRERETHASLARYAQAHAAAIVEMRALLRDRATVSNRDFTTESRARVSSYRGRKDSAVALYYLWRTGEVMVHHRRRFERVYALTERVAPLELIRESTDEAADAFLLRKLVAYSGLARLSAVTRHGHRMGAAEVARRRAAMLDRGELLEVRVEGWRGARYALASDAGILNDLAAGRVPRAWKPLDTTTEQEVMFLAPLDPVNARVRARLLFDFDYVWEVYKPASQRRWGYYTLPILWKDRLVARIDPKLDRSSGTLLINGLWLEASALARDAAFGDAMRLGLARLAAFLGAEKISAKAVTPAAVRRLFTR